VIRVLLADDQALVRAGFKVLVGIASDIEVVGEAADGEAAVTLARSRRADVVLMDIRMPGTDGIEATRQIVADPSLRGCASLSSPRTRPTSTSSTRYAPGRAVS
jgi:DNA-binding NarL/FixJ family response regulator